MLCYALQAAEREAIDISPPPEQKYELRVIVWKAKDCTLKADDSGLSDLYVTSNFEIHGQGTATGFDAEEAPKEGGFRGMLKKGKHALRKAKHAIADNVELLADPDEQRTDTHFRARGGKASWNWRFKTPVTMSSFMKYQRLKLQLWDFDILTVNDCLGEVTIPLDKWFRRVYRRNLSRAQYWDPPFDDDAYSKQGDGFIMDTLSEVVETLVSDADALVQEDEEVENAKFWVNLVNQRDEDGNAEVQGKLLVTVQLVPVELVEKLPAGHGRSDPNSNPKLPKPVGRLKFSINPIYMCSSTPSTPSALHALHHLPHHHLHHHHLPHHHLTHNHIPRHHLLHHHLLHHHLSHSTTRCYQMLGPKLCRRLLCVLCTALCCTILYYMIPVIFGNVITSPIPQNTG